MRWSANAVNRYRQAAAFSRLTGLVRLGAIVLVFGEDPRRGDAFSTANNLPNVVVDLVGGAALLGLLYRMSEGNSQRRGSAVPAAAMLGTAIAVLVAALSVPIADGIKLPAGGVLVAVFAGQIPAYLVMTAVNAEDQAQGRYGASLVASGIANVLAVSALLVLGPAGAPDVVLAMAFTLPLLGTAGWLCSRPERRALWHSSPGATRSSLHVIGRAVPRLLITSLPPMIAYAMAVRADTAPGARLSFNLALAALATLAAVVTIPAVDIAIGQTPGAGVSRILAACVLACAALAVGALGIAMGLGSALHLPSQLAGDALWLAVFFPVSTALYAAQRTVIVNDLKLATAGVLLTAVVAIAIAQLGHARTSVAWGLCTTAAVLPAFVRYGRTFAAQTSL